jgi:hypothetical protein
MPHAHFHKHLAEEIQMLHAHFHEYLACENRGTAKPAGKGAFYGEKRGRNARVSELNLQASDAQCHAPRFLRARRSHGSISAERGGGCYGLFPFGRQNLGEELLLEREVAI